MTCDLCGEEMKWSLGEVNEVEVKYRNGVVDRDGGFCGEIISVDMCWKCFGTKLMPWLRSQGAEPLLTKRES